VGNFDRYLSDDEMAVVSGIKSLSDEDRTKHLKAINEHRMAIDRHQQGI
jgi:hypothetical protein